MKSGLGKGINAFWSEEATDIGSGDVTQVPVLDIDRNPAQPRRRFDDEELGALTESVGQFGVIQPLVLVRRGSRYQIVAGERRWRAALKAGLKTVPAVIRDYSEKEIAEVSLIENLQRTDLNDIEKADAMYALMKEYGYTQEQLAARLSVSRSAAANLLRLRSLSDPVKKLVTDGKLSGGHARALVPVRDERKQLALAQRILDGGLSVRAAEKLAADALKDRTRPRKIIPPMPELEGFADDLRETLRTRVRIDGNYERGRIVIDYFSRDELEGLYETLSRLKK